MRDFRETLASCADAFQVLQFLGVPGVPVYMIVVAGAGFLLGIDIFWILVLAPISAAALFAAVIFGVMLFQPDLAPNESWSIEDWTGHDVYTVWIAACLWSDHRPWPHIPADSPSYPDLQKIKSAIQAGQIQLVEGNGNMKSRVSREELARYAESIGERPRFLFPDD